MQTPDAALTSYVTLGMPLHLYRCQCAKELVVLFIMAATSHMWLIAPFVMWLVQQRNF